MRTGRRTGSVLAALTGAAVLVSAGMPASAAAQEVLTESCTGGLSYLTSNDGNSRMGQSFTASLTGALTRAEIPVRRETDDGSGTYVIDVLAADASGVPTNTLLAREFILGDDVPGDADSTLSVTFEDRPAIATGDRYAVVVSRPGANDHKLRLSDPCDGRAYFSTGQAPAPFQVVLSGNSDVRMDIYFTLPEPPTSPPGSAPALPTCGDEAATVAGTDAADTLTGTPGPDVIVGGEGGDRIQALGGDDEICAGGGADRVMGGAGRDVIRGMGGADRLLGGSGGDRLLGGRGKDGCKGAGGKDRLLSC